MACCPRKWHYATCVMQVATDFSLADLETGSASPLAMATRSRVRTVGGRHSGVADPDGSSTRLVTGVEIRVAARDTQRTVYRCLSLALGLRPTRGPGTATDEKESKMETVGLIGAGAMGLAMVERFLAAGLRTYVYDVSEPAVQRAVALGAVAGLSAGDVAAASEAVSVMVRTDDQLLESVLGPGGALSGLRRGGLLLLHSTVDPGTTRTIAEAAQTHGVD